MEQILLGALTSQMTHRIGKSQHRLTKDNLRLTTLITLCDRVTCLVDVGWAVDIACLDFSKAFSTVSHSLLLGKQVGCGVDECSV